MVEKLVNLAYGNVLTFNGNFLSVVSVFPCKVFDVSVQCCAEKHCLARFCAWQHFNERAQVRVKAHVEHAVSFINNKKCHTAQVHRAAFLQIDYAARCSNQNVHAFFELAFLLFIADTAVKACRLKPCVMAENLCFFFNLHGKFSCRHHDECFFAFHFGVCQ